jgi:hypothetical protein
VGALCVVVWFARARSCVPFSHPSQAQGKPSVYHLRAHRTPSLRSERVERFALSSSGSTRPVFCSFVAHRAPTSSPFVSLRAHLTVHHLCAQRTTSLRSERLGALCAVVRFARAQSCVPFSHPSQAQGKSSVYHLRAHRTPSLRSERVVSWIWNLQFSILNHNKARGLRPRALLCWGAAFRDSIHSRRAMVERLTRMNVD